MAADLRYNTMVLIEVRVWSEVSRQVHRHVDQQTEEVCRETR